MANRTSQARRGSLPKAEAGGSALHENADPSVGAMIGTLASVSLVGSDFLELQGPFPAGSLEDLKLKFTRRIIFLANRWRNRMNEELRKTGQSHARWITLIWIHLLDGRANHRELAERIGVELPTLIRLLNSLEAEGLVERCPIPGRSGRAKTVRLTAAGMPVLAEMNTITERVRAVVLEGVDQSKLAVSMSLFDDLLAKTGGG